MPKLGMQPIRREQIIKATMHCIATMGVHKSSMHKIADVAGMTSSLIVHYFKDRTQLLEAVYIHLYQRMDFEIQRRVKTATTPLMKVQAICEGQSCDEILDPELVVTWVALFALIPELPSLARLDRIYAKRIRSNITFHLRQTGLSREEAALIAEELPPLIDGLWLRKAADINFENDAMRAVIASYLARSLSLN